MAKRRNNNRNVKPEDCEGKRDDKRGRGNSGRGKGGQSGNQDPKDYTPGKNDIAWYSSDPQLLLDAARVNFSWATGQLIHLYDFTSINPDMNIPGLQIMWLRPSVGYSVDAKSPINLAAVALYTDIRSKNAGAQIYNPPDLMIYIIAMSQTYGYINFLQRAYNIAFEFSGRNVYVGDSLLEAQCIDPVSLRENLADFRTGLNVLINSAARLAVPAALTWFPRQAFLYRDMYTEGTSWADQLYMYAPYGFYQFALDANGAGGLYMQKFFKEDGEPKYTYKSLIDFGNAMLNAILQLEDSWNMSGDILKAYGDRIIKLQSQGDAGGISPIFNIGVLEQMKNATVVNRHALGPGLVLQSANKYFLENKFEVFASFPEYRAVLKNRLGFNKNVSWNESIVTGIMKGLSMNKILTTSTANTDAGLVMESSRLMVTVPLAAKAEQYTNIPNFESDQYIYGYPIYSGSEICCLCRHYTLGNTPATKSQLLTSDVEFLAPYNIASPTAQIAKELTSQQVASNFKFHPISFMEEVTLSGGPGTSISTAYSLESISRLAPFYDIDNFAIITDETLAGLHNVALMNLFYVSGVAAVQK